MNPLFIIFGLIIWSIFGQLKQVFIEVCGDSSFMSLKFLKQWIIFTFEEALGNNRGQKILFCSIFARTWTILFWFHRTKGFTSGAFKIDADNLNFVVARRTAERWSWVVVLESDDGWIVWVTCAFGRCWVLSFCDIRGRFRTIDPLS